MASRLPHPRQPRPDSTSRFASWARTGENTRMDSRRRAPRFGLLLLLLAGASAQEPKPAPKYTIVDGHLHFLSFVQETDGMATFIKAMDDTGVAESVVIGMPVVKKWDEGDSSAGPGERPDGGRAHRQRAGMDQRRSFGPSPPCRGSTGQRH